MQLDPTKPDLSSNAYPVWVNDLIRAELKRRRLGLGLTPYAMAIPGRLSAETIRNVEKGRHSPSVVTLGLICRRLGVGVEELIQTALSQGMVESPVASSDGCSVTS